MILLYGISLNNTIKLHVHPTQHNTDWVDQLNKSSKKYIAPSILERLKNEKMKVTLELRYSNSYEWESYVPPGRKPSAGVAIDKPIYAVNSEDFNIKAKEYNLKDNRSNNNNSRGNSNNISNSDNLLSAYLYKDDASILYIAIADETYRDDDIFDFLSDLRRASRPILLNNNASNLNDDVVETFYKSPYFLNLIPKFPISRPRTNSKVYEVSNDNNANQHIILLDRPKLEDSDDNLCAADGYAWRGVCGEFIYRFLADTTLTIFFGTHEQLSSFARVLLFIHSIFASFFLSVLVSVTFESITDDPNEKYQVTKLMTDNVMFIALGVGVLIFAYILFFKWILIYSSIYNDSRQDGHIKAMFSFLERVGHIPIALLSCFMFAAGMCGIAFYAQFITSALLFLFATGCFFAGFLVSMFNRFLPEIMCGWNALKNYVALFTCCTYCRWVPDSALGLFLTEYFTLCAPDAYDGPDIPCCLLSYPCCREVPTFLCDECCFDDTPLNKILSWLSVFFSSISFIAALFLLYDSSNSHATVYQATVYVFVLVGYSMIGMMMMEIGWIFIILILSIFGRCFIDCLKDCFEPNDTKSDYNEKLLAADNIQKSKV